MSTMWRRSRKLCSSAAATCLRRKLNDSKPHRGYSSSTIYPLPRLPRTHLSSDLGEPLRAPVNWAFYSSLPPVDESEASAQRCWNCGSGATSSLPEPFLACGSCRAVQSVDPSVDYFQIFGLEKGFEIRVDNLERIYKDWQKKLHPDLVHTKSEREKAYAAEQSARVIDAYRTLTRPLSRASYLREKAYAAEQSARVIDAYRTLTRPLSRASYLLQLEGIHVDEEKTVSNPELLAEVMEIREAVEEANGSQALEHMKSEIQQKLENSSESFSEAFKTQNFENAVTLFQRMTYYDRAIQAIVKKL